MPTSYTIHTDVKFQPLELIDVNAVREAVREPWFNQSLTRVNDCVVRLGVVQGEFHWHKHDQEDEFFYVVAGRLYIDVEGGPNVSLEPGQGFTVPRGVVHRTRAPEKTTMLMFEGSGVRPTGD